MGVSRCGRGGGGWREHSCCCVTTHNTLWRYPQADFANRYIGGGVLVGGCVQEEIAFAEAPELVVTLLFCTYMRDDEALVGVAVRLGLWL